MATNNKDPKIKIRAEDKSAKAFRSAQENLRNLASSAAVLEGPLGQVAGRINAVGAAIGRMNPLLLAGGVGFAAMAVAIRSAITNGSELEQQTLRLEAVLKATGNSSGLTASQIDDLAYSIAEGTLASQEGARDAAIALTTFSNVSGDVFERTLKLAQDHVAVFGGSLTSAVTKFGRALDNPREGLQGLSRQYTVFDSTQRQFISTMFESGNEVDAQNRILEALEARIGGAGAAAGKGLAGAVDTLGEKWRAMTAAMATETGSISFATTVINSLSTALQNASDWLAPSNETIFRELFAEAQDLRMEMDKVDRSTARGIVQYAQYENELGKVEDKINKLREAHEKELRTQDEMRRMAEVNREARISEAKAADAEDRRLRILRETMKAGMETTLAARTADEIFADEKAKLDNQLNAGAISVNTYNRALEKHLQILNKSKKIPGLGEIDRFLAVDDTDKIKDSYARRKALIVGALGDISNTEVEMKKELIARLKALDDRYSQDLIRAKVQTVAGIAQSSASILSSLASIQQTNSQQQLERVNADAERRAEIVQEQLDKGIISEAEANAKLKKIESDRQKNSEAGAKKSFESSKKLQRAAAIVNTAAAVTLTLADKTIQPFPARLVAAAAIAAAGAAQIAAINATSFSGGGSVPGIGGATGQTPGQLPQLPAEDRGSVTIQFIGDQYGWDSYMEEKVISGIRDAVDNRDVTLIGRESRQYQELQP